MANVRFRFSSSLGFFFLMVDMLITSLDLSMFIEIDCMLKVVYSGLFLLVICWMISWVFFLRLRP